MTSQPKLSRDRLCRFAGVKRRTHLLWTKNDDLLPNKAEWGEVDLIRAAQLGAVWSALGPSGARAAWADVSEELPNFGGYLELVYSEDDEAAWVAKSPRELSKLVPRGVSVVVVDLASPMQTAKDRYAGYKERRSDRREVPARSAPARLRKERAS
jgi:hypothetical protein